MWNTFLIFLVFVLSNSSTSKDIDSCAKQSTFFSFIPTKNTTALPLAGGCGSMHFGRITFVRTFTVTWVEGSREVADWIHSNLGYSCTGYWLFSVRKCHERCMPMRLTLTHSHTYTPFPYYRQPLRAIPSQKNQAVGTLYSPAHSTPPSSWPSPPTSWPLQWLQRDTFLTYIPNW